MVITAKLNTSYGQTRPLLVITLGLDPILQVITRALHDAPAK